MRVARFTFVVLAVGVACVAGVLGRIVGGVFGAWSIAVVALAGGIASGRANGGIAGIVVAVALVLVAKRSMRGDPRDRRLRGIAHSLARRWGTSFVGADLSGADFTGATVAGSDLRGANLEGVTWDQTRPPPANVDR